MSCKVKQNRNINWRNSFSERSTSPTFFWMLSKDFKRYKVIKDLLVKDTVTIHVAMVQWSKNPTASALKDGCALGSMTAAMPTEAMTRDKDIKDSLADIDMLLKPFNLASDSTAA